MNNPATKPRPRDDEIRMGSEYASAKTYLARTPRPVPLHPSKDPQHGSNDSDFGFGTELPD